MKYYFVNKGVVRCSNGGTYYNTGTGTGRTKKIKMVNINAGVGSATLSFEKTNEYKCVFASESNKLAYELYNSNFYGDYTTLCNELGNVIGNVPEHDIIVSNINECTLENIDSYKNIITNLVTLIDIHQTKYVVMECDKNLIYHNNGNTFDYIKKMFINRDMVIYFSVLNTYDYTNIPYNYESLYFVCIKNGYHYTNNKLFSLIFDNVEFYPIKYFLETPYVFENHIYLREEYSEPGKVNILSVNDLEIIDYYNLCITNCNNIPTIVDKHGLRLLTPRECFNIHGFPKKYNLGLFTKFELYRLFKKSGSVSIMSLIAERLIPFIQNSN